LVVALALQLALDERVALPRGQRVDRGHGQAELLAALERLVGPLDAVEVLAELVVRPAVLAQQVQRRVAGDAVQPRAQVEIRLVAGHRLMGAEEGLLNGILGAGRGQDAGAVGQQRAPVTVDDRLEGRGVAGAHEVDQPRVALRTQQRGAREACGLDQPSWRHVVPIGANACLLNQTDAPTSRIHPCWDGRATIPLPSLGCRCNGSTPTGGRWSRLTRSPASAGATSRRLTAPTWRSTWSRRPMGRPPSRAARWA